MCLGIPGKVAETYLQNDLAMAKVEFGGIRKEICLAYVPEAVVGDYVIVHAGFAISRVDEEEAAEIFSYLEQIGEMSLNPDGRPLAARGDGGMTNDETRLT
jgi:hydrogenase expression/formation protein HypC